MSDNPAIVTLTDASASPVGTASSPLVTVTSSTVTNDSGQTVAQLTEWFHADAKWGIPSAVYASQTVQGTSTVTAGAGEVAVFSGTSLGGVGTLFSTPVARCYNSTPGRADIEARFSAAAADGNAITLIGPQTATDGMGIGIYQGAPHVFHKVGGKREIVRFEITAGTGGAPEDITITLNGVATVISSVASGLSAAQLAWVIGETDFSGVSVGYNSQGYTDDGSVYVDFTAFPAANLAGANSFASTGSATATVSVVTDGDTGTDTWVAREDWNDPLDGTGASGVTIDLANTTAWSFEWTHSVLRYYVTDPVTGQRVQFHTIAAGAGPVLVNTIMPVQVIAYAAGATAGQTVYWSSWSGHLLGARPEIGGRRGLVGSVSLSNSTPTPIISIRAKDEFNGLAYNAPTIAAFWEVTNDSTTRAATASIVINGTLTGASFERVGTAGVLLADTTATAITGGVTIATKGARAAAPAEFSPDDLRKIDLLLQRGATISVVGTRLASSGTINMDAFPTEIEDR